MIGSVMFWSWPRGAAEDTRHQGSYHLDSTEMLLYHPKISYGIYQYTEKGLKLKL